MEICTSLALLLQVEVVLQLMVPSLAKGMTFLSFFFINIFSFQSLLLIIFLFLFKLIIIFIINRVFIVQPNATLEVTSSGLLDVVNLLVEYPYSSLLYFLFIIYSFLTT